MSSTWITIGCTLFMAAVIFFAVFAVVRNRPLTCALYFLNDKSQPVMHILGYETIMPDEGDSFEIYKHYIFNRYTLKFELLAKQRGTGLDLKSNFVKRSLDAYYEKNKTHLEFGLTAAKNGFTFLSERADDDPEFEIYQLDSSSSDTEIAPDFKPDALIFTRYFDHGFGKFSLTIQRNGKMLASHKMEGSPDFYLMGFCDNRSKKLIFTFGKQKLMKTGMGLCVINYLTGELELDQFVR